MLAFPRSSTTFRFETPGWGVATTPPAPGRPCYGKCPGSARVTSPRPTYFMAAVPVLGLFKDASAAVLCQRSVKSWQR